jgi:hypothetical protein
MISRFDIVNNTMVTNALLQFLPIIACSFVLLLISTHDLVWGFSLISFIISLSLSTLLVATYETDVNCAGKYFHVYRKYNLFAYCATIFLLCAVCVHITINIGDSVIKLLSAVVSFLFLLVMIIW